MFCANIKAGYIITVKGIVLRNDSYIPRIDEPVPMVVIASNDENLYTLSLKTNRNNINSYKPDKGDNINFRYIYKLPICAYTVKGSIPSNIFDELLDTFNRYQKVNEDVCYPEFLEFNKAPRYTKK